MTVAVVEPGGRPERWSVPVPGSKSITNRVLALAAVADGTSRIANALPAGDTQVMVEAIEALGAGVAPTRSTRTRRRADRSTPFGRTRSAARSTGPGLEGPPA